MAFYLASERRFIFRDEQPPDAITKYVSLSLTLEPSDVFGVPCARRTTFPVGSVLNIFMNTGSGESYYQGDVISRIAERLEFAGPVGLQVEGNILTFMWESLTEANAHENIGYIIECVPPLLTLFLGPALRISHAVGRIWGHPFHLGHITMESGFRLASADDQIGRIRSAVSIALENKVIEQRLYSSLLYFSHACELRHSLDSLTSTFAEFVLNLAKTLETLFGNSRDLIREGAAQLGLTKQYIEERLIPILLLRSEFDIAHPRVHHLTDEQKKLIGTFIRCAFHDVRVVLKLAIEKARYNEWAPRDTGPQGASADEEFLDKLRLYLEKRGREESD